MNRAVLVVFGIVAIVAGAGWVKVLYDNGAARLVSETPAMPDAAGEPPVAATANLKRIRDREFEDLRSITEILQLPTLFARREALHRVAGRSSVRRVKALIAESLELENPGERREFLLILYARFGEIDPGKALDHLRGLQAGNQQYEIVRAVFLDWARRDIDAAIAAVGDLDDKRLVQAAGDGVMLAHQLPERIIDHGLLARLPIDYYPGPVLALAIGALAGYNPESAAQQTLALQDVPLRRAALHAIGEAWAVQDPAAALAFAMEVGDRSKRWHLEHTILERWATSDPAALLDAIEALPANPKRDNLLTIAVRSIAERDPLRAIEFILARRLKPVSPYWDQAQFLSTAYSEWAVTDFSAAFSHADSNVSSFRRLNVLGAMARRFASDSPQQALDWAMTYTGANQRELLAAVVSGAADTDLQTVVAFLTSLDDPRARGVDVSSVIREIAMQSPDTAAGLLGTLSGRELSNATASIAQAYASRDPQMAVEWAMSLDKQTRDSAVRSVLQQWAQADPVAAAGFVTANREYQAAAGMIVHGYAQHDPKAALQWLLGLDDKGMAAQHTGTIFSNWIQSDRTAAVQMLAEHRNEDWAQNAMSSAIDHWAAESPAEAAAWLATMPPDPKMIGAVGSLARQWGRVDTDAALTWAQSLSGRTRDHALQGIIVQHRHAQYGSPLRHLSLVNTIADREIRFQTAVSMATIYARTGGDVEDIIRGVDLGETQQTALRENVERLLQNVRYR